MKRLIAFLLVSVAAGTIISAKDKLILGDTYFDGYSYSRRYSLIKTPVQSPHRRITWYTGRFIFLPFPIGIGLKPIAEGPECFIVPDGTRWLSCTVITADGSRTSDTIAIEQELPVPQTPNLSRVYLTLPRPGMTINLKGKPKTMLGSGGAVLVNKSGGSFFYRLDTPGYYGFTVDSPGGPSFYNVFVSPVDSVHTDRIDKDWYYTQFKTTTTSNCGPTVVSMGIAWAGGGDVPVVRVRQIIGWQGTGAVDFAQMRQVLTMFGVDSEIQILAGAEQIFSAIDDDCLVGILYDMSGLTLQEDPGASMFDQYYTDKGGHYLAIKGYSKDKRYFIIYDPIPSDWKSNAQRYIDGTSMFGRNRYYRVDELLSSVRDDRILIMKRPSDSQAALKIE